jgi:hypothetical protein
MFSSNAYFTHFSVEEKRSIKTLYENIYEDRELSRTEMDEFERIVIYSSEQKHFFENHEGYTYSIFISERPLAELRNMFGKVFDFYNVSVFEVGYEDITDELAEGEYSYGIAYN